MGSGWALVVGSPEIEVDDVAEAVRRTEAEVGVGVVVVEVEEN